MHGRKGGYISVPHVFSINGLTLQRKKKIYSVDSGLKTATNVRRGLKYSMQSGKTVSNVIAICFLFYLCSTFWRGINHTILLEVLRETGRLSWKLNTSSYDNNQCGLRTDSAVVCPHGHSANMQLPTALQWIDDFLNGANVNITYILHIYFIL